MIATTLVKLENTTDTRVNLEFLALFTFYMSYNLFANTRRIATQRSNTLKYLNKN